MSARNSVPVVERRGAFARILVRALLLGGGLIYLAPFAWMVSTSLKTETAVFRFPPEWLPRVAVAGAFGKPVVEFDGQRGIELGRTDQWVYAVPDRALENAGDESELEQLTETVPIESVTPVRVLDVQWGNYLRALTRFPFHRYVVNTLFISVLVVIGTILSCCLPAYGFSRLQWRGRDVMFVFVLATLMIPASVVLLPQFILFRKLGWIGTFAPLIVPHFFGNAFDIFLFRQFFMTIPRELSDAGRVDGASELRILFQMIMPLSKPVIATVAMMTFMFCWLDFLGPLVYITDERMYTLALGLEQFLGRHGSDWSGLMAAATATVAPVIVLFLLIQRLFVQGVALTGMKG
jgi:ABC-type glycerol-3-phosphate transport system permease component